MRPLIREMVRRTSASKPLRKPRANPCMMRRPLFTSITASYSGGPLCSLIQSPIPLIQPVTLFHMLFRPSRKPLMMDAPALYNRLPTLPIALVIRPGNPLNQSTTAFHLSVANCAADWKKPPILPGNAWKNPTMPSTHEPRNAVNRLHNWRPVSVCVKNQTSAATSAPIAVTTIMIGFAFMATFKAHCAISAAVVAKLKPCNADVTALTTLATLNAAKPPPMATSAPAMGSAFALTQSPNSVSLSATIFTTPAAPVNASPTLVPMPPASFNPCNPGAISVAIFANA